MSNGNLPEKLEPIGLCQRQAPEKPDTASVGDKAAANATHPPIACMCSTAVHYVSLYPPEADRAQPNQSCNKQCIEDICHPAATQQT